MESLGTLTGGIAHDMNNVLGAILGVASANLDSQPDGRPTLPVLIATGRVDQTTANLTNLFPGIHVVPKPFKMGVLQKQLERLGRN